MPNAPVFMRASPAMFGARTRPAAMATVAASPVSRMTTTVSEARLATFQQPVAMANPRLAMRITKIRPHIIDVSQAQEGDARESVKVPIAPAAEPTDAMLFDDPADPAKKYYLPRYRLRETGGRYEIGIVAAPDGKWRLSIGLERFPAPELGASVQGAAEIEHPIAVFFRYGAGPANAIEKRVDFNEKADDPKGVTVSVSLSLNERDNLLFALQTPAARPSLVVRRAITVAAKIVAAGATPDVPMLVAKPNLAAMARLQTMTLAQPTVEPVAAQPAMMARPQLMRMRTRPLAAEALADAQFVRPIRPVPPQPVDRYRTIERALDDVADPEPFFLDPRLHPYLYDGAAVGGGGARVSEFRRIVQAYPQGAPDARFHAYLQDKGEPWVFYYLPDSFKLARRDVAPYLPQMVVRIAAPDGALENASVTIDYVVEPWVDQARLKAAAASLKAEIPAATTQRTEPELRPLQARASLRMWVPGQGGAALADQKDVAIDLANGYLHSLTLPLEGFRQLYGAAYSRDATSLFSGQVLVETGLATPEPVPVEIRFAHTQGEILSFGEQPSDADGTITVRMKNDIESTVRLPSLPVRVRKGEQEVAAGIEGIDFSVPIEMVAGSELSFTVRPGGAMTGEGVMDAIFDTAPVEILPDPEKILPLISDTSVPAQYERQIDVMTMAELMGDAADPNSIILINVEFRGGGNLKLTREQAQGVAQVQLPLMDLLLGKDTQGKYGFRQQIIRRNGSQTVDPTWREADFSLLVLPIV